MGRKLGDAGMTVDWLWHVANLIQRGMDHSETEGMQNERELSLAGARWRADCKENRWCKQDRVLLVIFDNQGRNIFCLITAVQSSRLSFIFSVNQERECVRTLLKCLQDWTALWSIFVKSLKVIIWTTLITHNTMNIYQERKYLYFPHANKLDK